MSSRRIRVEISLSGLTISLEGRSSAAHVEGLILKTAMKVEVLGISLGSNLQPFTPQMKRLVRGFKESARKLAPPLSRPAASSDSLIPSTSRDVPQVR
jgi:hypothetical protein